MVNSSVLVEPPGTEKSLAALEKSARDVAAQANEARRRALDYLRLSPPGSPPGVEVGDDLLHLEAGERAEWLFNHMLQLITSEGGSLRGKALI